jgi:hypothetical protein
MWGTVEMYRGFWRINMSERNHLEDPGMDGRIIIRWIIRKLDVRARAELMWLRIGKGDGHL